MLLIKVADKMIKRKLNPVTLINRAMGRVKTAQLKTYHEEIFVTRKEHQQANCQFYLSGLGINILTNVSNYLTYGTSSWVDLFFLHKEEQGKGK